jgi:4-hydroxybenzoate polyprenyltransferase
MLKALVALTRTMRPMTWASVIIAVFTGMVISLQQIPPVKDIVLIAGFLPMFILGYANTLNAYTDYKIDEITRPYRAIPQGIIQKKTVLYFAGFLFLGAVVIAIFMLTLFQSFLVISGLILATTYSIRPTRIKARGPAAPVAIATGYVFIPIVGGASIYGITADVVVIALVLTAQTAGASISKDFIDLKGDDALHMGTIPLTKGLKRARTLVLLGLGIPVIVFPSLFFSGWLPRTFLLYIVLVPWIYYIHILFSHEKTYEKAYINTFFFCAASIFLSGVLYVGGIL